MKVTTAFNIRLLDANSQRLQILPQITSGDVIAQIGTRNLHPEGLYSTEFFGEIGSRERSERFAYIKLNTTIIHPYVFNSLKKLKSLYTEIILSTNEGYAIWDPLTKDFIKSTADDPKAQRGMSFFLRYFKQLDFKSTESVRRDVRISNVTNSPSAILSNLMVIPAGMRDIRFNQETGQIEEEEINNFYKSVIFLANNITTNLSGSESALLDAYRREIQLKVNQIYDTLKEMIDGKKKIIQSQWGGRNIYNSTRNVIVPLNSTAEVLGDSRSPSINQSFIGLYQAMKMYLPMTIHNLKQRYFPFVFNGMGGPARLINPKTLQLEEIHLHPDTEDLWVSNEGLEKIITYYKNRNVRRKPVKIDGYYFGLIYVDEEKYSFIHHLGNLPQGWDKKQVRPITWMELFYLSSAMEWYDKTLTNTRYPVAGMGSIYPTKAYVKTTNHSTHKVEYQDGIKTDRFAREYPDLTDLSDFNAMAISSNRLKAAGGDFDGDMMSAIGLYGQNAEQELHAYFGRRESIIGPNGKHTDSVVTEVVTRTFASLTS